jgi:hypothetical protein
MKDLLEAITIFVKYSSDDYPTCCEHDTLYVLVDPSKVSDADKARLDELGFIAKPEDANFMSFHFGSA